MPQSFEPNFNPNDVVQLTMDEVYQNARTLREKFSGATPPASPKPFQWWANTLDDFLYIRNETNTSWIKIYDFNVEEIILKANQVDSEHISGSARKGTIVENQDICPATCCLSATAAPQSMPAHGIGDGGRDATYLVWVVVSEHKIWVPSTSGTLHMMAYCTNSTVKFNIGGLDSSTDTRTSPAWGSVSRSTTSLSGWQTLKIYVRGDSSLPGTSISAWDFRWEI